MGWDGSGWGNTRPTHFKMPQSKSWCFTSYHVLEKDWYEALLEEDKDKVEYLVAQLEKCPRTGKCHVQGYVRFKGNWRETRVHRWIDRRCHWEVAGGSPASNRVYCTKEESRWPDDNYWMLEWGKCPEDRQGKRTDLDGVWEMIKAKANDYQIFERFPNAVKYKLDVFRAAVRDQEEHKAPEIALRQWQVQVWGMLQGDVVRRRIIWVWSAASKTGKSTFLDYVASHLGVKYLPAGPRLLDTMMAYNPDVHRVIAFDLTRADSMIGIDKEVAVQLEKLSTGGPVMSSKFSCVVKYVNVHVIAVANQAPPHDQLPERIIEFNIDDGLANPLNAEPQLEAEADTM